MNPHHPANCRLCLTEQQAKPEAAHLESLRWWVSAFVLHYQNNPNTIQILLRVEAKGFIVHLWFIFCDFKWSTKGAKKKKSSWWVDSVEIYSYFIILAQQASRMWLCKEKYRERWKYHWRELWIKSKREGWKRQRITERVWVTETER